MSDNFSKRDEVVQVVNRMSFSVDTRDWSVLRGCFADRVRTDYTSLVGGDPAEVAADDLIAGWKSAIEPLDGMQHVIGSHVVEFQGETAVCTAQVIATHRFHSEVAGEEDLWTCAGHYRYELSPHAQAWRIGAATFTLTWETGDRAVLDRAARAASS